ncbi:AAA family ATPase [Nocardioides sp. 503]|uniref:ATP-dependent nuclease n=1 Tax=Nocardioides sp. 503 TaxID=2508326 RepID=UPI00106F71B8|nr:AAA family ATPase [Nocardioides sp. 503]
MGDIKLRSLKLVNYKGFADHTISFRHTNVLVGANNAGKSTALGALRLLAAMLPAARRARPNSSGEVEGRGVAGWSISAAAVENSAFAHENIRHDFLPVETRIELLLTSGVRLIASWEDIREADEYDRPPNGTFFVFPPDGGQIMQPRKAAQELVPEIAVVPTLTPLDDRESYVGDETFRRHQTSRRSSRYFRNALYRLATPEWDDFRAYVYERTPEVSNLSLHRAMGTTEDDLDLYYEEEGTRREREITWAGDGIQIWLQALFHIWGQRTAPVVLLDEPDVFLHPDLQRRLARALFATGQQTVLATHSVEILAEAEPGSAVWIDRSRRTAERPRSDGALGLMGRRLGSGYELGVGRALRSNLALFVEGDDVPIIAHMARQLGVRDVASSDGYATIPLGGFSRNALAGAFAETMSALGSTVETIVVLDGDMRSSEAVRLETAALAAAGAHVHIWRCRELENYLLNARAIAKVSGLSPSDAETLLQDSIASLENEARDDLQAQRMAERKLKGSSTAGSADKTILVSSAKEFAKTWETVEGRIALVDAKAVLRQINSQLQFRDAKTVNAHSLAKNIPRAEISRDVVELVSSIAACLRHDQ